MAGPTPPQGETTSYSDPLYDKLDGLAKFLGRRWFLVVLLVVVAVAAWLVAQKATMSPDAASAAALQAARRDSPEAIEELLSSGSLTVEFQSRAALELARRRLSENDIAAANDFAKQSLDLAEQAAVPNLQAAAALTLGAVLEAAGETAQARERYLSVVRAWRGKLPTYAMTADIAAAALAVDLADAAEATGDTEEATALRLDVLRSLSAYAGRLDDPAQAPLVAGASWRYYDLRRRHPDLAKEFDQQEGIERPASAYGTFSPEAPAEAAEADEPETPGADADNPAADDAQD